MRIPSAEDLSMVSLLSLVAFMTANSNIFKQYYLVYYASMFKHAEIFECRKSSPTS